MTSQNRVKFKISTILFLILLFSFYSFADSIPGVPKLYEQKNHWCWAASCESIVKYYDPSCTKTQTQIASVITTQNTAPPPRDIIECLEENGKNVDLKAEMVERPLTWSEIKEESDNLRPFIMLIRWNSGGYHCNVNAGYIKDSTRIKWMDPMQPPGHFVLRSYKKSLVVNDRGEWESTFLTRLGTGNKKNIGLMDNESLPFKIISTNATSQIKGITIVFDKGIQNPGNIQVYNALGTCVFSSPIDKNTSMVTWGNPHTVPSGMYYALINLPYTHGINNIYKQSFNFIK